MSEVGKRIKEIRQKENLSQARFGAFFNVTNSTVSHWEKGDRQVDVETLKKISQTFHVSMDYLLGEASEVSSKKASVYQVIEVRDFQKEMKFSYWIIKGVFIIIAFLMTLILKKENISIMSIVFFLGSIFLVIDVIDIFFRKKNVKSYHYEMGLDVYYESSEQSKSKKLHSIGLHGLFSFYSFLLLSIIYGVAAHLYNDNQLNNIVLYLIIVFVMTYLLVFIDMFRHKRGHTIPYSDLYYRFQLSLFKILIVIYDILFLIIYSTLLYTGDSNLLLIIFPVLLLFIGHIGYIERLSFYSKYQIRT